MDEKHLHEPLLPKTNHASTTETSSASTATDFVGPKSNDGSKIISPDVGISTRLLVILLIGIISVWANHEASKGFSIMVINNTMNTRAVKKFTLFYVSNDEAIRLVQSSFNFAVKVLFPSDNNIPENLIDQVDIQLASHNLTNDHTISVKSSGRKCKYLLSIDPLVMELPDFKYRIRRAVQRGMTEILLFNLQQRAPKTLLDGMVEYVIELGGFGGPKSVSKLRDSSGKCWEDTDPRVVAKFLAYSEEKNEGFVVRMNQEMSRYGWYEGMMDRVLGIPAIHFCASFKSDPMSF